VLIHGKGAVLWRGVKKKKLTEKFDGRKLSKRGGGGRLNNLLERTKTVTYNWEKKTALQTGWTSTINSSKFVLTSYEGVRRYPIQKEPNGRKKFLLGTKQGKGFSPFQLFRQKKEQWEKGNG